MAYGSRPFRYLDFAGTGPGRRSILPATQVARVLTIAAWFLVMVVLTAGCHVTVGGRERELLHVEQVRGEVEWVAERREDRQETNGADTQFEALEFEERIRLRTQGHVGSPEFFSYRASVGAGLTQHEYELDGTSDNGSGTLQEYDLSADVLPEKMFPWTFRIDKSEARIPRQFAGSLRSEREGINTSLAYRSGEWPMSLHVGQNKTRQQGQGLNEQDLFRREDQHIGYSVDHAFSEQSDLSFDFRNNDTTQTQGGVFIDRQEQIVTLSHNQRFGDEEQYRLDSFVDRLDQSGDFELVRLLWQERLKLRHSQAFQTHYGLSFHESKRPTLKNNELRGETGFTRRFYQNLVTHGSLYLSAADLGQGVDQSELGGDVGFNYYRHNPWGTLFARYNFSRLDLEQTGGTTLVNVVAERHPFLVAGSLRIELKRTNVLASSIVVLSADRSVIYSDYFISQTRGITEIIVLLGGDITTDGDQTLSIDYDSLTEPAREEIALMHSVRLREQFHLGVSVYYEFQNRSEALESLATSIVPDEFAINTVGVDYRRKGLRLLAEYSHEDSTRIPSRSKRMEGSYLVPISEATRMTLYGSHSLIDYLEDPVYDVQLMTVGGTVRSRLTETFRLSGRLDYRDEDDSRQGKTRGFQWDVNLKCAVRQVSADVGIEYDFLNRLAHERKGTYVYARLKRMF